MLQALQCPCVNVPTALQNRGIKQHRVSDYKNSDVGTTDPGGGATYSAASSRQSSRGYFLRQEGHGLQV